MDEKKRQRYLAISKKLAELVGGEDNIQGVAHCATRLRIVLEDNDKADLKAIEDLDLAKGVFVAGDQLQIIFGAGLVNDVYEVFTQYTGKQNMSLSDLKTEANKKMNPIQRVIKALSDVFIDIMPGILAAALLTGLSGVLANMDAVQGNETLFGITRLINISSGAIFGFLPLAVAYSACKRFGGRPILGIVMGCIMLSPSLADAYAAAQGTVEVTTLHLFGLGVDLVGFQGGIIVALLMGVVTAKLDLFFEKKVPEVIRLLVSPLLTTLVGALLLFTAIGPLGRGLASVITGGLVWMTQNLGVFGYALFSGLQQLVVITGLHHIFGAIEAQLLADTGRNILNPLMSVAMTAQGGAVLGYLMKNRRDAKTQELCIPSFISVLFGITEPALFGVNVRFKYPLIGGCIGGAIGGAFVYFTNLAALGFGTTVVPGIALADPAGNGYVNYVIAHVAALAAGFVLTLIVSAFHCAHMEEFNLIEDIPAAQVLFDSGVPLVQLPCWGVAEHFSVSRPELERYLAGKNPLADYLASYAIDSVEQWAHGPVWTKAIWDMTAAAWLMNDGQRFMKERITSCPRIDGKGRYCFDRGRPSMKYVYRIERDALMTDLIEKLLEA